MNSPFSPYPVLFTSLAEIESFNPCKSGWRRILIGQNKTESDSILFPIVDAVESNTVSDVCWLLMLMLLIFMLLIMLLIMQYKQRGTNNS